MEFDTIRVEYWNYIGRRMREKYAPKEDADQEKEGEAVGGVEGGATDSSAQWQLLPYIFNGHIWNYE